MKILTPNFVKINYILAVTACLHIVVCFAINDFPQLGKLKVQFFCQNSTAKFGCTKPAGSLIQVKLATFGRALTDICVTNVVFNKDYRQCDLIDRKELMKDMCDYKNKCEVFISEEMFGNNMCPDVNKYLNLMYVCVRNPKRPTPPLTTAPTSPTANTTVNHTSLSTNKTEPSSSAPPTKPPTRPPITPQRRIKTKKADKVMEAITFNPDAVDLEFLSNRSPDQLSVSLTFVVLGVISFLVMYH